ncbi:MAG: hypothetical protein ACJ8CR_24275 [Roseiflexaceae bacterium]
MTNPSIPPVQSAQSDIPELPGSSAKAASPNGGAPAGDAKPPDTEAKAASPNGGAPAGDAKPPDADRNGTNVQEIPARLPRPQGDEDQSPSTPPKEDPWRKFDEQRKKQAAATADAWRDAVGAGSASSYTAYSSGGVNFGAGNTIGSVGTAIGGNQVHGGIHHYYSAGSQAKKSLTPQQVKFDPQKLKAIFVEPTTYSRARRLLAKEHLVVLHGPLYSGKWTTGLYLLQAKHGEKIDAIASHLTAEDFDSLVPKPQQAYIIDTINATSLLSITSSSLRQLADNLKAIGSHCVLVVDSADPLKNRIDEYLVPVDAISDPIAIQILEKHVMWLLQHTPLAAQARALCQESDVQAALVDRSPREVVVFAELLIEVASGKFDLTEALKRFKNSIDQAANWFAGHPTNEQRTCLLAVAVLSGAECQQVLDAQYALFKLLTHAAKDDSPTRAPVFDPRRSQWIDECRAQIVNGSKISAFGQSIVRRVVLKNQQLRDELLSYVWQEYDQLHRALLQWLRDLGRHSDPMVRNGAATAAGAFAKLDLDRLYREVLLPWAEDEQPEPRFAAALALAVLANDDNYVWDALRLTRDFSRSASEQCLLTAATAYGGIVGARFPEEALEDLATIAKRDSVGLAVEVYQSVVNLFNIGYIVKVFMALEKWTADPEPNNLAIAGANIFLNLTDIFFTIQNNKTLPFMLLLANTRSPLRDVIIKLWRRLLNTPWARRDTLDALHEWILQADTQRYMYPLVEQLVRDLLAHGAVRERERLLFYLRQWAQQPTKQKPFTAAARILAAVVQTP